MGFAPVGIRKLSELEIDADKDWQEKVISNLAGLAGSEECGDIWYRGSDIVERLAAGDGGQFLQTKGVCQAPVWADVPGLVNYERFIYLTAPAPTLSVTAVAASIGGKTATKALSPTMPTLAVASATNTPGAVGQAVADDGGAQTDETTETNSGAADDMTLLPATPAVNDAYYFGLSNPWDYLCLNISTPGVGTWTVVWEYWDGAAWTTLPGLEDGSVGFTVSGKVTVNFDRPGDWATSTIMLGNLYWIRARVSAYTAVTTQPLGQQAWIGRWT